MLAVGVFGILLMFCLAGLIDVHDARRGRRRRPVRDMIADRVDLERDMYATQHHGGLAVPIDDICRDRQCRR